MAKKKKAKATTSKKSTAVKATDTTKASTKATASTTLTSQVESIIKGSGKKGISALDVAQKLGLIKKDMDAGDRGVALKKVRTLCRKATEGIAARRDGRSAVYVHSTNAK